MIPLWANSNRPLFPETVEGLLTSQAVAIRACRVCRSTRLDEILSLGNQYVSDFVSSDGDNPQAPLELVRCKQCGLVQLRHTFSRGSLYRHYWYKSGISPTMRNALADLVARASEIARPIQGDIVLDIGCNDGTLLRSYGAKGLILVGFEPAENLIQDARKGTDRIFNDFFSEKVFKQEFDDKKAKIVTSVAMFYDLEDPNSFVADVANILAPAGVWVVQQNYLATMLEQNGFDNISHEHLEYYSLETMQSLLKKHRLEIFDVVTNDVNGGSFRTFICHIGQYPTRNSVAELKNHEARLGLGEHSTYDLFAESIRKMRTQAREFIAKEVENGKTVYVYGASNRGNTILQYYGLDHTMVRKATDANPEKWGRKTVGTFIPIVSKEEARRDKPDYFLILPHHFLEEITRDEKEYLEKGGKFIVPLPQFRVVTKDR
jgi:NDP-4-keto-2,6-dideoxyhexose 3-C-methyltransferase